MASHLDGLEARFEQSIADKAAEVLAFLERMFATLTKSVDKPGENIDRAHGACRRCRRRGQVAAQVPHLAPDVAALVL